MTLAMISLETRELFERVKFSPAENVARSIAFACGANRRLMQDVLQDLARCALWRQAEGEPSQLAKLRRVREELGL